VGLPIVVKADIDDRLPIEVEEVFYRVAQEALHNIVKHAGAREVRIELTRDRVGDVRLRIIDDGKGFDPGAVPDGHLGLTGMRARMDKLGGRLDVVSRSGEGTTVEAVVPAAQVVAAAARSAPDAAAVRQIGVIASAE
jgi:signal transduction histidine kinase